MLYTVKKLYNQIKPIDYMIGICSALGNSIEEFFLNNTIIFIEKEINTMKFEINCKSNKKAKKAKQRWIIKDLQNKMQNCLDTNDFVNFMKHKTLYESYITTFEGNEIYQLAFKLPQLPTDKSFDQLGVKKPNHYFDIVKNWYNVKGDHVPLKSNYGLWIGVEIECIIPKNAIKPTKTKVQLDPDDDEYDEDDSEDTNNYRAYVIERIKQEKIKFVSVKSDGSINCDDGDNEIALEFTVLTRVDDMSNLLKLCKLLNTLKAKVNKTCGLHIHLDQRDIQNDTKALSKKVVRFNQCLELLKSVVPKSRLGNSYCITDRAKLNNPSRYYAINTEAIGKFGTIEIRLHSGTTDFVKISNWIKLCYGISMAKDIKNSSRHVVTTIEQLKDKYVKGLSDDCVEYFKGRAEFFKKENEKVIKTDDGDVTESELSDYETDNILNRVASIEQQVVAMSTSVPSISSGYTLSIPRSPTTSRRLPPTPHTLLNPFNERAIVEDNFWSDMARQALDDLNNYIVPTQVAMGDVLDTTGFSSNESNDEGNS